MIAFPDHIPFPFPSDSSVPTPSTAPQRSQASGLPEKRCQTSDLLEIKVLDEAANTEELGDEIARLAAHIHAATYQLLVLIRKFDEAEGWTGGFRSCAHWLAWRTGIAPGPARERVRVAKALGRLPLLSAAMAQGEMSFSKVRALTRKATPENEAALLEVASHATAARTEELIRCWIRADRLENAGLEDLRHQSRFLQLFPDQDGSYKIRGRLDPEVGAMLEKALEWAAEELYRKETCREVFVRNETKGEDEKQTPGEGRRADLEGGRKREWKEKDSEGVGEAASTFRQRQADALGLVAESALKVSSHEAITEGGEGGRRRHLPKSRSHLFQIVVHADAADLEVGRVHEAALEPPPSKGVPAGTSVIGCHHSGPPEADAKPGRVAAHIVTRRSAVPCAHETARRLACDAGGVLMAHGDDGGVLNVGRKRRTIPPAIRRALEYRDRGCRFPGCGCRFTDAHHIVHWADGGETKLDNLVLICRRHHRALHEEGYGVVAATGEGVTGSKIAFRFIDPDGRTIPDVPAAPPVPADPVEAMMGEHAEAGIEPNEWTPTPQWHGEALDYSLAIDMFRGTFR